jgi:phosphomannomutase
VNLFLVPKCGIKFFRYVRYWKETDSAYFTADEKEKIISYLKKAIGVAIFKVKKVWGRRN